MRGVEVIDRLVAAIDPAERRPQLVLLNDLCDLMVGRLAVRDGRADPRCRSAACWTPPRGPWVREHEHPSGHDRTALERAQP